MAWIGLGSNLGDRSTNLLEALQHLRERTRILRTSSVYETEPAYYTDQPRFLNMVAQVETELDPTELLGFLKGIERRMGRQETIRYGPRVIDLDLLLYDDAVLETPELTVPHPRMAERPFVLVPLAEVSPDVRHPLLHRTIAELSARLTVLEGAIVRVLPGPTVGNHTEEHSPGGRAMLKVYSEDEIRSRLEHELPGWSYEDGWIQRLYRTDGWPTTLMLVNAIGFLAEAAYHHPDLVVGWSKVWVKLKTHSHNGITDKDFELAKKIDEIALWRPPEGSALEGTPNKFVRG